MSITCAVVLPNFALGKQLPGGKDGFAKMAGDNVFRLPYRGEVDAVVPAQSKSTYIDIRLRWAGESAAVLRLLSPQERFEQLRDAGVIHALADCRWREEILKLALENRKKCQFFS